MDQAGTLLQPLLFKYLAFISSRTDFPLTSNTTITMPLRAKRKRAQVSYFEQDDELDELLGVEAKDAIAADDVEMVDEEGVYGSEKVRHGSQC